MLHPSSFGRLSLGSRLVVVFLALLLAVQGAGFVAIRIAIDRNARTAIDEDLAVGERALKRLLAQQGVRLSDGARLLAADYGFRAAVSSGDAETIGDALANHGERIGATVVALLDTSLALRASTRTDLADLPARAHRLQAAGERGAHGVIDVVDGKPMQFVLVPMKAPVVVGYVLMGFRLDDGIATDLRSISGLHLAILTRRQAGLLWSNPIGTLPGAASSPMVGRLGRAMPGGTLYAGSEEYSARVVSLAQADDGAQAVAVLLRSVDEAIAPYRQLQLTLLAFSALGLVAFVLGSVATARRVTGPIRALTAAAERLGGGDCETPLAGLDRGDEVGGLARSFESMRRSIAEHRAEVLQLAYGDRLTGLPNRLRFRQAAQAALETLDPQRETLAVLVLDLDRFKHVNDVLGFRFGDEVLKAVGERLSRQSVREGDLVARIGGNAFAVLLPRTDAAAALAIAARVAALFDEPLVLDEQTVDLGAGIGIACWPQHAGEADLLLSRAEVAMYAAKRATAGPQVYDPAADSASAQTLSLLSELRHAVEHGELRVYLQPKIALADGRVVGAEALVRWQHPTRGLVPPDRFIPFAEQTGFVRRLTLWMFEEVARQWEALCDDAGVTLRLAINLSTRDLMDLEIAAKLEAILLRHGVPSEAFCLEITESAIMDDPLRAEAMLRALDQRGFKLSIDDFGTGYSSLAYLKRLPVSELKIDRSFVMAMQTDADDATIVRSTIDLAHNLGLSVVAEGVENAAVWMQLQALDCDEAQGYHMSRPLPAAAFAAWCVRWSERAATGWAGLALH